MIRYDQCGATSSIDRRFKRPVSEKSSIRTTRLVGSRDLRTEKSLIRPRNHPSERPGGIIFWIYGGIEIPLPPFENVRARAQISLALNATTCRSTAPDGYRTVWCIVSVHSVDQQPRHRVPRSIKSTSFTPIRRIHV